MSGRLRLPALAAFVAAATAIGVVPALPVAPAAAAAPAPEVWTPGAVQRGAHEQGDRPVVEGPGAPAPAGQPVVAAPPAGTELPQLRGPFSRVVSTGQPGGHRAEVSSRPLHFKDAQGRWQPIDSTLVPRGGGFGNAAGPVGVQLGATAAAGSLASVRLPGGTSAGFSLAGARPAPGVLKDRTVTYPQALPQVDLKLTSDASGVKEELVLTGPTAARTFDFPLALSGLTAQIDGSGALLLRDDKGAVAARSPRGWMADSAGVTTPDGIGRISEGVTYRLVDGPAGPVLRMTLDGAWLADPARVYPVVVDPPIAIEQEYSDTFVAQDAPATNFNSDTSIRVGRADPATASVRRGLARFDLARYAGARIFDADLELYNFHSDTCAARSLSVRRVTSEFGSASVTWDNQPTSTTEGGASSNVSHGNEALGCANAPISYEMTQTMRNWVGAPDKTADWANLGVAVHAGSETDSSFYKTFASEQSTSTPPRFVIDYDNAPTVALTSPGSGWRYDHNPTLTATYTDKDDDAGAVTFTVKDRTGATVRTLTADVASAAGVSEGVRATAELSGNPLPAGWYSVSAVASDGRLSSAATGSRKFAVTTAPAGNPGAGVKPFWTFEDTTLADRAQLRVNVANGNLLLRQKDLAIRGTAGHDLTLERTYNSQQAQTRELGTGWALGPAQQVGLYHAQGNAGRDLVFEDENQTRWLFTYSGTATSETWTSPAGLNADLRRSSVSSEYRLTFRQDKRKLSFREDGALTVLNDRGGNVIDPQYDGSEYVKRIVDSQSRATALNTTNGRLNSITDPAGRVAGYTYTGDNLTSAQDLAGKTWTYTYGSGLTAVTDPRGATTKIAYTADGRVSSVTRVTDPVAGTGPTTNFAYHAAGACPNTNITGKCTVVTDANNNPTTYGHDSDGKVTKTYDALGHKQDTGYDSLGNVTSLTGNGNGTTTPTAKIAYVPGTYKVDSVDSGAGGAARFGYGDASVESPTSYTSPQGTALSYSYRPGDGNLSTVRAAGGGEDRYRLDYHADGTLKNYSQPNLVTTGDSTDRVTTSLSYTGGNLTGIDFPEPLGDSAMSVDTYSRRTSQTDGKTATSAGTTTGYAYDSLDRLTKVTYASGATIAYGYDANGNQTSRTTTAAGATTGSTTTYTYDALNRQTSEAKPGGPTISLTYDPVGNLRTYNDPSGTVEYRYNAVNLLSSLLEPGGATTSFAYDNDNNRTKVTYPSGVTQTSTYNDANAVKTITAKNSAGTTTYLDLAYDYRKSSASTGDDTNLRSKVTDRTIGQTTDYAYESEFEQLKSATTKSSAGSTIKSYTYAYDANGQRTTSTVDGTGTNYAYNPAGQLTGVSAGPAVGQYAYNGLGSLTSGGGHTLGYNERQQTSTVNGTAVSYEDKDQAQRSALGSRSFLNTPLGVSNYSEGTNSTAVTREPSGQLTGLRRTTGTARSYPLTDALGSVVALTDGAGAKTDTFGYDPYGNSTSRTGTTDNPFRFTGEYQDPSGLYKIGLRYYQPDTGRWTQLDPLRRAVNPTNPPEASPYLYVGNNPVNYTDPQGTDARGVGGALVAGVAGVVVGAAVGGIAGPLAGYAVGGCVAGAVAEGLVGTNPSAGSVAGACAVGGLVVGAGKVFIG